MTGKVTLEQPKPCEIWIAFSKEPSLIIKVINIRQFEKLVKSGALFLFYQELNSDKNLKERDFMKTFDSFKNYIVSNLGNVNIYVHEFTNNPRKTPKIIFFCELCYPKYLSRNL